MGYFRHECIVVSGAEASEVLKAQAAATAIFNEHDCGNLVGGIVQHLTNGGAMFMIAVDGSKEGWHHSDIAEKARAEFVSYLKTERLFFNWAHLILGGDDGEYRVLNSPAGAQAESA